MKKPPLLYGFLVGVCLGSALLAVLYLGSRLLGTPFPPFDVFDLAARVLPGDLIRFGEGLITSIAVGLYLGPTDSVAKTSEQLMGVGIVFIVAVALVGIYWAIVRGRLARSANLRRDSLNAGLTVGLILGFPLLLITAALNIVSPASGVVSAIWLTAVYLGFGAAVGVAYSYLAGNVRLGLGEQAMMERESESIPIPAAEPIIRPADQAASLNVINRRQFIIQLAGLSATITVVGTGLSALLNNPGAPTSAAAIAGHDPAAPPEAGGVKAARVLPNADDPLVPAPGTRPEYTPLDRHYRIDIVSGGFPNIDEATYKLPLTGLVENPVELTLAEIRGYESMSQYITMSCISNWVGGDLISTTEWTGVSMQKILDVVKPKPEAAFIKITAADGFWEYVDLALIREDPSVMLAYAWDGEPLRPKHGFPLRIHIPNRYGMKQPKWITGMEFVDKWDQGYWVLRGWDRDAIVRSTSVIDSIGVNAVYADEGGNKYVPIGGIAWSGVRGISKVEIQVNDGEWVEAKLRRPISNKTWVVWRYDWPFQQGSFKFAVRCTEGDGTPQITAVADVAPSGATGIHSKTASL